MNDVVMEPARTLHGQLQRGLGRAARAAADHPGAGEYVLDCVRRDPRRDPRCESRDLYYARLMVALELPVAPIADPLFGAGEAAEAGGLALEVLAAMVRLSRHEAAAPLRDCARSGTLWFEALDTLVALADPRWAAGLDEVAAARCDDDDLDRLIIDPDNPVIVEWAGRRPEIAAARDRRRAAGRVLPRAGRDRPSGSDSALLELARRRDDRAVAAIFELGRRRAPALLDLAEELLPGRPGRWGGALCRALRDYGAAALPRARDWARSGGECAEVGLRILSVYGTRQDVPVLLARLDEAVRHGDWRAAGEPAEGLGRLRSGEAVQLLRTAWTETTYSYLRPRLLAALTRTAPHTAENHTVEGLWDSEEAVRVLAAGAAPLTPATRQRLRRLADDPAEDPQVRAAARRTPR